MKIQQISNRRLRARLTVTEDTADHTGLDNVDLTLDQRNDGDKEFDQVTEGGIEQTAIDFT